MSRTAQATAAAAYLLLAAPLAAAVALRTGGLGYTLDDAYIHLAVAEMLLRGGYGINPGEFSSPSSSILYVPLLALGLALGLGAAAPLLVNLAAGAALAWMLAGLAAPLLPPGRARPWAGLALLLCLLLGSNALGLAFTGMEHLPHAAVSVAAVIGLARLHPGRPAPAWLCACLVLAPLLRFEGLALSGAGIAALALLGRWRAALLTGALLVAALAAYAATMLALGLPPLPSSVLVKSPLSAQAMEGGPWLGQALGRAGQAVLLPGGRLVLALAAIAGLGALLARGATRAERLALGAVALALLAHLLAGDFGWFFRYEAYALAMGLAALLLLLDVLRRAGSLGSLGLMAAAFPLALACAAHFAGALLLTPAAAMNIHRQQYQMHRFATEFFAHPVAVNDLGWVSFRNDGHVLDLWGLGSEEARRLAATGQRTPEAVAALARRHGVVFAMIYDSWLGAAMPRDWCRIAVLATPQVTASEGEVAFYLADPAREAGMRAALDRFAQALPPEDRLETGPCPDARG